jgi:hypothetical protein
MRNILLATAAVGALALAAPAAHANQIVNGSGGGAANIAFSITDTASGSTTLANGVFVDVSGSSNAPGSAGVAQFFSSTTQIDNTTAATQTVTLAFIQNGFSNPVVPPNAMLTNNFSGTWSNNAGTSNVSAFGCVDPSNTATLTTQLTCPGGSTLTAAQAGIVTGLNGAFSDTPASVLVTTALSHYALDEIITITIAAGGNFNLTNSESLRNVPEPASLAILGVGLLGLGFVANRKRSV